MVDSWLWVGEDIIRAEILDRWTAIDHLRRNSFSASRILPSSPKQQMAVTNSDLSCWCRTEPQR